MNIYWMKRDFRLMDNKPLREATKSECLVLFILEPSVSFNYDFDIRHWRFAYQSILELRQKGLKVHILYGEAHNIFLALKERFKDINVYSHEETGNELTYARDLELAKMFKENHIKWNEYPTNAVVRGLKKRDGWDALWIKHVKSKQHNDPFDLSKVTFIKDLYDLFPIPEDIKDRLIESPDKMLRGGETLAHQELQTFLNHKLQNYWGSLSYPEKSRYYCSTLSAYISWGNITIKQIYQACEEHKKLAHNKESLKQFMARLKWHCHFIQKLELQPDIEYKNLNQAFSDIRQKKNKKYLKAWKEGQTGYPLIDAAMRCVKETGYLNFRLRSTVVSFLTHILWQPWQAGAGHLARQFLDYEPGIHFSQFQMQAGTTGINTIRIYNPIKQSIEKDKEGVFIKRWVPELANLPKEFIHEPWKMSEMDQMMYQFRLGKDYPKRIVIFEEAQKKARVVLWGIKKSHKSRHHSKKILSKHARRNRRES